MRFDGPAGSSEQTLRLPDAGPSVLVPAAAARGGASLDPVLAPARAYLSPSALGERLAAPWRPAPDREGAPPGTEVFSVGPRPMGLTVVIDTTTHLPLRLGGTDREGRKQAAVCRWP